MAADRGRVALAFAAAVLVTSPARAGSNDMGTLATREALLTDQAATARAAVRWRAGTLYRLALASDGLAAVDRARAVDAGARALARALVEERTLRAEEERARAELFALSTAAAAEPVI